MSYLVLYLASGFLGFIFLVYVATKVVLATIPKKRRTR